MTYQDELANARAIVGGVRQDDPVATAVRNIVPNFSPEDMMNLLQGYREQQALYDAKRAYETAAQGDAGNAQRAAMQAQGQAIRERLNNLGFDTSNADKYGAAGYKPIVEGVGRDLAAKIYSMPDPGEVFNNLRLNKLKEGMGERKATEQALAEVAPYRAQYDRMNKIAMGQLGTENGVMNNHGYTSALLSDNPERYMALYNSAYLMPGDIAKVDQKARLMQLAANIASGQSAQNYNQNKDLLNTRGEWQRVFNNDNHNYRMEEATHGANLNMAQLRDKLKAMSEAELERIDTLINKYGYSLPQAIGNVTGDNTNDNEIAIRAAQSKEFAKNALDLINYGENPREAAKLILQAEELRPTLQNANIPKNILKEYEERQSNLMKAFENKFGATYKEALEDVNFNGGK